VSAADIIDETLVRALEDLPFRSEVTPVVSWLMGHGSQVLRSEVGLARQRDHEGLTGTELLRIRRLHEAPYEDAIDEVERVDLGLDDLAVSTDTREPSAAVAAEEVRDYLLKILGDLPSMWRRAVIMVQMDEQPLDSVAAALGIDVDSLHEMLDHADAYLRARLSEDDLELPDESSNIPTEAKKRPNNTA
jgi:DNA-directed RNA polymerase specialized sigma24 family protein